MYMILCWVMFLMGISVFVSVRKHLLLTLLSMEFMVLILFLSFYVFMLNFGFELYFGFLFLCFSVCEGGLGLSILVSLIRCHGNDNISSLSMLLW